MSEENRSYGCMVMFSPKRSCTAIFHRKYRVLNFRVNSHKMCLWYIYCFAKINKAGCGSEACFTSIFRLGCRCFAPLHFSGFLSEHVFPSLFSFSVFFRTSFSSFIYNVKFISKTVSSNVFCSFTSKTVFESVFAASLLSVVSL